MYLVARDKAEGQDRAALLAPRDYLDLTPFLIADRLRARQAEPHPLRLDDQLLFVLQQYLEPVRQLLFADLGGSGDRLRPADTRDTEADGLLRQMGDFRNRYRGLIDQVSLRDQKRLSRGQVQAALWRSRDHLRRARRRSLRRERRRDGATGGLRHQDCLYRELFVEPRARRRSLPVIRQAGVAARGDRAPASPTCGHHLARLQAANRPSSCPASSTRRPSQALLSKVARISVLPGRRSSLGDFRGERRVLTVFVDALNEYSGPNGPPRESLVTETGSVGLRRYEIVASIRNGPWTQYCLTVRAGRAARSALFAAPDGGLKPAACRPRSHAAYQRYYRLRPESLAALSPRLQLLDRPFMMAMIAKPTNRRPSLRGRARARIPPISITSLFGRLTERKARDAQVLVPPGSPTRCPARGH